MSEDLLRYDILVQNALRGVIRKVLTEVQRVGLPGNHHFFVTFMTGAPGVRISNRIREQYPDQMTIVLQHQFWELEVGENGFGIGLSFSDIPEKLYIPFAAIRGFYDPSVNFELEFDVEEADDLDDDEDAPDAVTPLIAQDDEAGADIPAPDKSVVAEAERDGVGGSADVVSLDAFRKKK